MPGEAARFCDAEYPHLVGALTLYTGDRYLAEELAQEALLRAFQRWPQVRLMESPGGWLWRVAVNLTHSHFRRAKVARRARARLEAAAPRPQVDSDSADAVALRRAVAALPDRQKAALVLRYYLDLPVAEVAARMGTSNDAVRSLTKRAVAALGSEFVETTSVAAREEAEDV